MITYGHPAISLKECKNIPPGPVGTSRKLCQARGPGTALLRVDNNMVKGKAQTHDPNLEHFTKYSGDPDRW